MSVACDLEPILIVSTGRTGTKFLANFLSRFGEVEAHHTTPWSTLMNVLGNARIAGWLPHSVYLWTWRTFKANEFGVTDKAHFVDSNNHLYAFAHYAHEFYPRVKVIHVIRDPRSYVRSHINWTHQRFKSWVASRLIPFWQPNPFLIGEMSISEWLGLEKFEEFCWVWDFKNRYLSRLANLGGVPYLCLRFEDLTGKHAHLALERLLSFVGLSVSVTPSETPAERLNRTTTDHFPDWRQWPDSRCVRLHELCGRQMDKYGYGTEPEWKAKLRIARNG